MTEENKQAATNPVAGDTSAKKLGAIKGGLVGLGLSLLITGLTVGFGGMTDLGSWLAIYMVWVFGGALLGAGLPGAIARARAEEARKMLRWQKPAVVGALAGVAAWLLFFKVPDEHLVMMMIEALIFAILGVFAFTGIYIFLVHSAEQRRKTFRFLGWSLGAVVGLYLVVLAINIPDEDLLPEAKKVLESRGFTVKEEENAFFVIAGFDAPKGEDPHAFGRKRVSIWEAEEKKPKNERNFAEKEKALHGGEARSVKLPDDLEKACNWTEGPCLAKLAQSRDSVARFAAENPDWLERYQELMRRSAFEENLPVHAGTSLPPTYKVILLSRVRKAQCAVLVADGKTGDCLALLAEDVRLARRMLAGARTVYGKLGAAAMLRRDYFLLGEIVAAQPEAARRQAGLIGEMLAPLTPQEKDMTAPLKAEFMFLPGILSDLRVGNFAAYTLGNNNLSFFEKLVAIPLLPLLNPNASINTEYRRWALRAEQARLPAEQFLTEQAAQEKQEAALLPSAYSPAWLYNPIGKIFIAAYLPSARDFVLRLHDLEGRQRLLRLQWKIVEQKVPADKVAEFVAKAGPEYADPYTGQPMAWDAQKRTLTFVDRHEEWGKGGIRKGLVFAVGI